MANSIMYDVNGILDVANLIEKGNDDFREEYQNILNQIKFLRESFTGTVSESFGKQVTDNDPYFRNLMDLLEECTKILKDNADKKTMNAESLTQQIQSGNYFEGGN